MEDWGFERLWWFDNPDRTITRGVYYQQHLGLSEGEVLFGVYQVNFFLPPKNLTQKFY